MVQGESNTAMNATITLLGECTVATAIMVNHNTVLAVSSSVSSYNYSFLHENYKESSVNIHLDY